MANQPRLLLVHAHPDDETINNAATMASYVAKGAQVTLVTCTRGEEGEIIIPELAHLASDKEDRLGEHRIGELANAMKELGVTDFRFLGAPNRSWRDSGMMGAPQNQRPDVFWNADVEEAAGHLVRIINEIRPHVMITYDDFGGYGHPDHIQAHRVAMRAAEISRESGWEIKKIYWNSKPDQESTTLIAADDFVSHKMAAMRAHSTQITLNGKFFALSNAIAFKILGNEYYRLVYGEKSGPFDSTGRESDLFAGIDLVGEN